MIGGTSAVAPLWAALIARLNQKLGGSLGDVHAAFYGAGARAFRDITSRQQRRLPRGATAGMPAPGLAHRAARRSLAALAALKG